MTFAEALNEMYVHKACIRLPDWGKCDWHVNTKTGEIIARYTNPMGMIKEEVVIPSRVQMYVNREDWETSRIGAYI